MRRWGFTRNKSKIMSDINITPLTDVVMVLLVIFMVTTPLMMNDAFKIKLPKAASAEPQTEQATTTVSVTYPGNIIHLNNAEVSLDDLKGLLASRMAASPDKTVVIKADRNILHGMVVKVLDIAKESGALKLAIATQPEKEQ